MPMIEFTYPKGAIPADAREGLLDELATRLLAAEKAPDTEFFRSITWVYANEIEPRIWRWAGDPAATRDSAFRSRCPTERSRTAARGSSSRA